jgi:vacuolar-type H+-ATPase subunit H
LSDIYHLIDRLERLLAESTRMPLSAYLIINEDDFLDVIDQMRTAIPQQIKDGERLQRERERIVAQAEEEAALIAQQARVEAGKLVADHELSRAAELRANTVMERARREAEILKADANEYARAVLNSLDGQLDAVEGQIANLLITVRNGLDTMAPGREAGPEDSALIREG